MQKKVVGIFGIVLKMAIRYWASDYELIKDGILDIVSFAQECGLNYLEAKRFESAVETFAYEMAEDFIKHVVPEIKVVERRDAIIDQIQKDIEKVCLSERKILLQSLDGETLRKEIMSCSEKERGLWDEKENGVYTNCIKYIAQCVVEFVPKLPSYTPEALTVIVQRQAEYIKEIDTILRELRSLRSIIKSTDVTIREFEEAYREKIKSTYSKIELIGAGISDRKVKRYDISLAYVELACVDENSDEEIELSEVFGNNNVVWLKGEAGTGKTTFLQWVAICAANNDYKRVKGIRNRIPIVVKLRTVSWPLDLQGIINKISEQIGYKCPDGWMANQLKNDRFVILFDGLDEVEQDKREQFFYYVEELVKQYPKLKILITARNSIRDDLQCKVMHFEISSMKIKNIKMLVEYWHKSVLYRDAIEEDERIERLQSNLLVRSKRKIASTLTF